VKLEDGGFLFPALRCSVGDWIYYVTALPFSDIRDLIKPTTEVHRSAKLSAMIQRRLEGKRATDIAAYLTSQKERFFNAIVVGVYGGKPSWAPLRVTAGDSSPLPQFTDDQELELERGVGMLILSGSEKLFAIDGQHRVAGIKRALDSDASLATEELCTIFVAHTEDKKGTERTRRLFTTLNKTAKRVSVADIVTLDEDDGFAILARRMVDDYPLFGETPDLVVVGGSSALAPSDANAITSIVGLYELAQDLFPVLAAGTETTKAKFKNNRPASSELDTAYARLAEFWDFLCKAVPEFRTSVVKQKVLPGANRKGINNHLLFRPVGQRAFAGALSVLVERGMPLKTALKKLLSVDPRLTRPLWQHVLWDPVQKQMVTKNRRLAESLLLKEVGAAARTTRDGARLEQFLAGRKHHPQ
jgi:DNA sulfur modification protein DndB